MGYDCGFDMVPSLTTSETDESNWSAFLCEIKRMYEDDPVLLVKPHMVEFKVGEHPCLPVEGHKFLRFSSKVSGSSTAEPYIRGVLKVARKHFDQRVQFWHELADDYGHYSWNQVNESLRSYEDLVRILLPRKGPAFHVLTVKKAQNANTILPIPVTDKKHSTASAAVSGDTKEAATQLPFFTLQSIPEKGLGLVAAKNIKKGCRILAEKPIFTIPRRWNGDDAINRIIAVKLQPLPKEEQRAFFALHNNFPCSTTPFLGITKTNALPLGTDAVEGGIFLQASRINHACLPNCQHTWNAKRGEETIHAVRDIAVGEEITISYSDTGSSRKRRAGLKETFKIDCTCALCMLPKDELSLSDMRRKEIQGLDEMIGDGTHLILQPRQHLRWVHSLLSLLEAEGMSDASIPRAYYDAFQTVIAHGDQARAKIFAERAYAARVLCEGEDSESTLHMKDLVADPKSHRLFGSSSNWAQKTTKVPKDLESSDFEKWLWRQKS